MRRTAGRPLPSGRLTPFEAALFGTLIALAGIAILLVGHEPDRRRGGVRERSCSTSASTPRSTRRPL